MWIDILQWALPSGLAGAITWIVNKRQREIQSDKAINEAYENLSTTLKNQSDDIKNLYRELGLVRRAVERRNICRYYAICPVDAELRGQKGSKGIQASVNGQRDRENGDNPGTRDSSPGTSRPPPRYQRRDETTTRGGVSKKR
ncbi:hypothetical protein [Sanguibacteroides justesenii]|uniref:hypothetical protein n=1 Tax=Sanguibacteroides justesenii TaxID=1547597 RepID=UPI0011B6DF1A|nr:hypothetical protein [Sanguibacteroides justesenii]